jgi:hypothetical protein
MEYPSLPSITINRSFSEVGVPPSPPDYIHSLPLARQVTTTHDSINNHQFIDITEYLTLPQSDAAKKLNIPSSTLSKRWTEAAKKRKWPYRNVTKIDKEIVTLRK